MLRIAFIISLWPAFLSAMGLGGQLYYAFARHPVSAGPGVVFESTPLEVSVVAFLFFFLPIIASLLITAVHGMRKKEFTAFFMATVALDAFSLLYGLVLFGSMPH